MRINSETNTGEARDATGILATLPIAALEALIEAAIDVLDRRAGDPDLEPDPEAPEPRGGDSIRFLPLFAERGARI
jgi:hypothetical protein